MRKMKRRFIVWFYSKREPYKTHRAAREAMRRLKPILPLGMISLSNNLNPLIDGLVRMKTEAKSLGVIMKTHYGV